MTKWTRVWFWGNEHKDTNNDDWVTAYKSDIGTIEVKHGFYESDRWYEFDEDTIARYRLVNGTNFANLKMAKTFLEDLAQVEKDAKKREMNKDSLMKELVKEIKKEAFNEVQEEIYAMVKIWDGRLEGCQNTEKKMELRSKISVFEALAEHINTMKER